jgi:hypothetical protein
VALPKFGMRTFESKAALCPGGLMQCCDERQSARISRQPISPAIAPAFWR